MSLSLYQRRLVEICVIWISRIVKEMETDLACCLFVLARSVLEGAKECVLCSVLCFPEDTSFPYTGEG